MGDGGGGRWLVRMEWRPAGRSVCLPLLIFPCTIKSRSSLLAPAHPDGPGKTAVKRLCVHVWLWKLNYWNINTNNKYKNVPITGILSTTRILSGAHVWHVRRCRRVAWIAPVVVVTLVATIVLSHHTSTYLKQLNCTTSNHFTAITHYTGQPMLGGSQAKNWND